MLRNRRLLKVKFLRQYPVCCDLTGKESFFITDFYCHGKKLIIELDGEYHRYQLTKDREKTGILNGLELKVMRFNNAEVERPLEKVIDKIKRELK